MDTGIVYALADKRDLWHKKAVDFIAGFKGRLIAPSVVIPEICYLMNTYLGRTAEAKFVNSLINRELIIEHFSVNDLGRSLELMKKYDDLNLGFVDATVTAISERLRICKIVTTDRRHFSILKPLHCDAFTLLP